MNFILRPYATERRHDILGLKTGRQKSELGITSPVGVVLRLLARFVGEIACMPASSVW